MDEKVLSLKEKISHADAVIIGAGAGLSTAAGFVYSGGRFERYFSDFSRKYGFQDMYTGGFFPYQTREEFWAFWSRYIWINRYMDPPGSAYHDLYELVRGRDYFVLTTNVDHCFQKAGFDKKRLFYTQGDYGLFQCTKPCCQSTWDNESMIREMVLSQGFIIGEGRDCDYERIPGVLSSLESLFHAAEASGNALLRDMVLSYFVILDTTLMMVGGSHCLRRFCYENGFVRVLPTCYPTGNPACCPPPVCHAAPDRGVAGGHPYLESRLGCRRGHTGVQYGRENLRGCRHPIQQAAAALTRQADLSDAAEMRWICCLFPK